MAGQKKGGKKNRKIERNKAWCVAYRKRGQREKNKAKRMRRHLLAHETDEACRSRLASIS